MCLSSVWFHSGFNFTASSQDNVDTYQKIVETFKFSYALRTHLGDEMFANVSEVGDFVTTYLSFSTG